MTSYEEYALLDSKIKELSVQKDSLRDKIIEEMVEKGEEKTKTGVGSFTISKLKKWTYPAKVVQIGEDFKAAKAKAESTGDATYIEEPSLRFTKIIL